MTLLGYPLQTEGIYHYPVVSMHLNQCGQTFCHAPLMKALDWVERFGRLLMSIV